MAVDETRGRRQIMKDVRARALLPPSSLGRRVHSEAGCSGAAIGGVDQVDLSHAMRLVHCHLYVAPLLARAHDKNLFIWGRA